MCGFKPPKYSFVAAMDSSINPSVNLKHKQIAFSTFQI